MNDLWRGLRQCLDGRAENPCRIHKVKIIDTYIYMYIIYFTLYLKHLNQWPTACSHLGDAVGLVVHSSSQKNNLLLFFYKVNVLLGRVVSDPSVYKECSFPMNFYRHKTNMLINFHKNSTFAVGKWNKARASVVRARSHARTSGASRLVHIPTEIMTEDTARTEQRLPQPHRANRCVKLRQSFI